MKRIRTSVQLLPLLLLLLACGAPDPTPPTTERTAPAPVRDPHSFARPEEARVRHLELDLAVHFARRQLSGRASLHLERAEDSRQVVLDTRDLEIERVAYGWSDREASYRLGEPVEHLGRPLIIDLPPGQTVVHVDYATRPTAAALQWLEPEQTAGGEHPFLFTQSQAILARTWVPCQDTPAVRMTYTARLQVPRGMLAVMSAANPVAASEDGVYELTMPEAIPSYLLALAVGELDFRALGPRSGVYAEPPVVEEAAWELADTEEMIDAVEALYGPYRWGRYDLLVLPPSFPFGGMENPRLTFATPTILAGDRSLVALVAHELAHSWSGNLVTNATWNDFWLNEGFTVYLERRVMEELYGRDYSEMLAELGLQDLQEEIADLGPEHPDTRLHLDLAGRDPDEGMTDVAYEKGYLFLRALEESVGRERWDPVLSRWFESNAFRSVTSDDFLAFLHRELPGLEGEDGAEPREWVFEPGLPEDRPRIDSTALDRVEEELERWRDGTPAMELDTRGWTTHHWVHFLRHLPEGSTDQQLRELDAAFDLSATGNSEVRFAWLMQAVANDWEPGYPQVEDFLTSMGRRKFLEPLYEELARTESGLERARAIYTRARPTYHPLAVSTVDAVLGWEGAGGG